MLRIRSRDASIGFDCFAVRSGERRRPRQTQQQRRASGAKLQSCAQRGTRFVVAFQLVQHLAQQAARFEPVRVGLKRAPVADHCIDLTRRLLVFPSACQPPCVIALRLDPPRRSMPGAAVTLALPWADGAIRCVRHAGPFHSRCLRASTRGFGARRYSSLPGRVWRMASAAYAKRRSAPFGLAGAGAGVAALLGGRHDV